MRTFRIICGAAEPSADDTINLNVQGENRNVNLHVDYITRGMLGNVPDILIDLFEIGAYVYCGDQRAPRGSDKLKNFGEHWRRDLRFTIPVRHPEIWTEQWVQEVLATTLDFLSDDAYSFEFTASNAPPYVRELCFPELIEASIAFDEVALFSGGIDSFAGVAEDTVLKGKSLLLAGHYASTKVRNVQETLIASLKQKGLERSVFFVPIWVSNKDASPVDFAQRTRSFLFACLGLVIARMAGRDRFTFYENGVVGMNLPIGSDIVGGRATRTTHPRVLRGLEDLFSLMLDRPIRIETPLQWMTKSEVVQKIREAGLSDLLRMTFRCTRPHQRSNAHPRCGECSQCIDRRFAVLGAGMADHEPAETYKLDLLTADRSANDSLRMALSYVAFFKKVGATPKEGFLVDYPEVVSALDQFPGWSAREAGSRLYELFQRQAQTVQAVIADGLKTHAEALYRGELPAGSLLALCTSIAHVEVPPPSDYDLQAKAFMDRLTAAALEFAIDANGDRVLFRGGLTLNGS